MSPLLVLLIIYLGGFVFSFVCAIIATCVESTGLAFVLFLALFGVGFTVLASVAIQSLLLMDKEEKSFGKRQYFNVAKIVFIQGLVFAGFVVCVHIFGDDSMVPLRSSVSELWAMLWVAPIVSVVSCFVATGAVALFTVLWRVLDMLLKSPVGWWCGLMGRNGDSE